MQSMLIDFRMPSMLEEAGGFAFRMRRMIGEEEILEPRSRGDDRPVEGTVGLVLSVRGLERPGGGRPVVEDKVVEDKDGDDERAGEKDKRGGVACTGGR